MGKVAIVTFENSQITLSMVKWSVLRKALLFLGRKLGAISRFSPTVFVPSYECAVYDGGPRSVFHKLPCFTFYFADRRLAQTKFEELKGALQNCGLYDGLTKYLRENIGNANLGWVDRVNWFEEALRLFGRS
jgi:hypothetical protein